jgi:DNA-directed RNA polymerase specialized sigma24 family protein
MSQADSTRNIPWPTTLWSIIRDLEDPAHRKLASEIVASLYWRPVYAYLRRRGFQHHDACDRTQDFFVALLTRDWALRANEKKGRFRTFLVTLLNRYVRDLEELRQERFEKSLEPLPFAIAEDDVRLLDWKGAGNPEEAFWMQYLRDFIDRALHTLRKEADAANGDRAVDSASLDVFLARLEAETDGRPARWEDIAREHGMTVSTARHRFQKVLDRLRATIMEEIGRSADDRRSAGSEIDAVFELFRSWKK